MKVCRRSGRPCTSDEKPWEKSWQSPTVAGLESHDPRFHGHHNYDKDMWLNRTRYLKISKLDDSLLAYREMHLFLSDTFIALCQSQVRARTFELVHTKIGRHPISQLTIWPSDRRKNAHQGRGITLPGLCFYLNKASKTAVHCEDARNWHCSSMWSLYYGQIVSTQRIYPLFRPLLVRGNAITTKFSPNNSATRYVSNSSSPLCASNS